MRIIIMKKLANKNSAYRKNLDMSSQVYALRKRAMAYIYEAKALLGGNMPRIDIRVVEYDRHHKNILGEAFLSKLTIWINKEILETGSELEIRQVVFHELVHTITGFVHDDNCVLMRPVLKVVSKDQQNKAFLKYFN